VAISDKNSRWSIRGSFIDFDHLSNNFIVDSLLKELEGNVSFQVKLSELPTTFWSPEKNILLMEQCMCIHMKSYLQTWPDIVSNVAGKMSTPIRIMINIDSGSSTGSIETAKRWYQQNKDTIIPALIIG
jgi:hypothetical protein